MDGILDEVGLFDSAISDAALDDYFLQLKAGVGLYGAWT